MAIRVSTDLNALDRKLRARVEKYPGKAVKGINRTMRDALTFAVRTVQKSAGASAQKTIRRNLTVVGATAAKPEAKLIAFSSKKDRIPIIELNPSRKKVPKHLPPDPVSYGRQQTVIPGSFVAKVGKHIGIFKRRGKAQLPIDELKGPSVALVFARKANVKRIRDFIRQSLPKEIARAMENL